MSARHTERHETVVIGGGQAGLATGYHLARRGLPFVILDARDRIGDTWRERWDSLRLFTPAGYCALPGKRFPSHPRYFPTKDEFADYLEGYADEFDLRVRSGVKVDGVTREGDRYVVTAGERRFEADNVIVAMANYQQPWKPDFADRLDPDIVQVHSADYRNPGQLRPGPVLIVGAGNSGSEIARELAPHHPVRMSGRDVGQLPFRPRSAIGRVLIPVVLRGVFYRLLSVDTPIGRSARPKIVGKGGPLIRVKRRDLAAAGVERVARAAGVRDGRPLLDDGEVMDVANVVWCTGFRTGFESWIHLPIHGPHEPEHQRGRVPGHPGLFFVGLHFQRALSSAMIHGVGRDAGEVADAVADRCGARSPARARGHSPAPAPDLAAPSRPRGRQAQFET